MSRLIFATLGWLAVGLGLLGVLLPGLPTVPFMILAAFLFAKGSPRARAWLVEHRVFGPHILNWEASGSITPRAKRLAVLTMATVLGLSLLLGAPWWVVAIQVACMGPAALFVWTRPEPAAA